MDNALYPAFVFTVALLFTTAYFILGGLPLLILQHDVPLDAKFVRAFFALYYRAAFWASLGALASFLAWGRLAFAAGAGVLAIVAILLRKSIVPVMERLGARIETADPGAIRRFRKVHAMALAINVAQLVVLVWGTLQLSRA